MSLILFLLVLAILWVFFAPFAIMNKIDATEERTKNRIEDMENRLTQRLDEIRNAVDAAEGKVPFPDSRLLAPPKFETAESRNEAFSIKASIEASDEASDIAPLETVLHETREIAETPAPSPIPPEETFEGVKAMDAAEDFLPQVIHLPSAESERDAADSPLADTMVHRLYTWLVTEGNIWVCTGVGLFFVGFGLLFSYAVQTGLLTLEMRLAAAAFTGIVMTGFGFRIRGRRRAYALILQGGGMGVLYLVILAATKFNALSTGLPVLSPVPAVVAMLFLSVFTVLLALLQDYQPLALFAILGGFAAPLLVSAGSRNHTALFAIYSLLNLEILLLSFKRDWRLLNRMGFVASLAVGAVWGLRHWSPELFGSVEPFLLIFLAIYTVVPLGLGRKEAENDARKERAPDLLMSLSTPFSFFFLQMKVVGHLEYGMAFTCLGLGLWHLAFGAWLKREAKKEARKEDRRRVLPRLHILLCFLFSNLVVPYSLKSTISSAIWAVEGAFLIAVACRCGSYKALLGGMALHGGALALYGLEAARGAANWGALLSPFFVSGVMFALSHWSSGFWAARFRLSPNRPTDEKSWVLGDDAWEVKLQEFLGEGEHWVRVVVSWVFTMAGSFWWWTTIYDQIPRLESAWLSVGVAVCLTALVGCWMSVRLDWKAARFLLAGPLILWPFSEFGPWQLILLRFEPSLLTPRSIDVLVYTASVGMSLYLLRKTAAAFLSKGVLFLAFYGELALASRLLFRWGHRLAPEWGNLFSSLPLLAALLCLWRAQRQKAVNDYRDPIVIACGLALLPQALPWAASFLTKGSAVLGVFVPVLNPLELWQASVLFSLALSVKIFWLQDCPIKQAKRRVALAFSVLWFVWINQVAVRSAWWYAGTSLLNFWEVLWTTYCQALIAILWGILGTWAVLYGRKTRCRALWLTGVGLLAIDMIKLLLIDLNRAATLIRILAFLVLGALFFLIGWAAPLPPPKEGDDDPAGAE